MATKPMNSHTFRGRRYRIKFHNRFDPDAMGLCEHPNSLNKTIHIRPNLSDQDYLETVLDEAIHACLWELDNDIVDQMSTDIARFLVRLFDIKRKEPK